VTKLVIDASVAVKWFLKEQWSSESLCLLDRAFDLCAPDHMIAEMGNVVWKYHQRGELTDLEAGIRAEHISRVGIRLVPSVDLIEGAMRVASEFSMALYDALYVELAVSEGIQLVTTDDHMIRKLEGSRHRSTIVHLRDLGRYA